MYRTSSAYKSEMKKDLRDRSYLYVFLGLINRDAQESADITSVLTDYSDKNIYESSKFEAYYATCEENFSDDNTFFMPDDPSLNLTLNQGAVSQDLLGAITFTFDHTIDKFGGVTLDFGDVYPTEFEITNGNQTYTYTPEYGGRYIAEGNFTNSDYITITPITMVGGQQRMRIHSIMFGIGFQFTNKDILSSKRLNEIDHLSRELPRKSFEFTISNYDQKWTMDNPNSYARALEEMQIVQASYGRELPDGTIFKIPSLYMALNSWSSDRTSATFRAVGFLDYSNTTYYAGQVGEKTLYALAEEVFEDMGVDYKIDPFLRKLKTKNPLPIDTHKACLQMIANAGLCTMYEDANGIITLKSSMKTPRYEVTVEGYEDYSDLTRLTNSDEVYNFATCETDYATDDTYFFEEVQPEKTIVSKMDEPFVITIDFEAIWTFTGLTFRFGIISPSKVTIAEYNDGSLSETNDYDVDDLTFFIDHEFYEVDKLVITFTKDEGTRIHLNKLLIGNVTDYEIREHEMMNAPIATQTERIKSVNVKYYDFIQGDKQVTSQTNADIGDNLLTFDKPCYDYVVDGCTITDSGAYYVIFTSDSEKKVKVTAKQYDKAEAIYSIKLRETGQDVTLENDLISDSDLAERVCEWLAEFYAGEVDYTINYTGEPALESGDRIYLENRFVNNNLILVTSEELSTGVGMSMQNTVQARQISYTI